MFESTLFAPNDPILGLADLFYLDNRSYKINLGIGVYKDELGNTPILNSVKNAEHILLKNENTKNYLNIEGLIEFAHFTQNMLFKKDNKVIKTGRMCTIQTLGGTGALRIAADFISTHTSTKRIWISNPSWPNHRNIFSNTGFEICYYQYYDEINHKLLFDNMINSLRNAKPGDIVLFHGCCHNPTGIDLNFEQWQNLAQMSHNNGWLPLFDFAYQGFANNINEDAKGLRLFLDSHEEMIIASSYSKNFGLYNERVGALTLLAANSKIIKNIFSQIKSIIRSNYSNPPAHGANIVITISKNQYLYDMWQKELSYMNLRIKLMRTLFVNTLIKKNIQKDISFLLDRQGMFSFIGLNKEQVFRLNKEFGIYIINSGRINFAAITPSNITYLCNSIKKVF
ncbi:aromatic amino acid aminotransferase [Candidatus Pantoea edessiphila]|uniref:Aminotransferase n=1 Tax=Candidatus Pantoea edessiphila TaxID=2044610 RepID=A0A2P5SZ03_9GAMM|nr:amino acid aminotransferase [Candidatus Pantoea edessiphila]MBK4775332.1 aspartate/tyrosine/aromatic aminotransferase [Pantoea sp. Edef]PPI87533.1 aromatic amino acid aminotransferase [Candidatus Pantoea edessiphila]